MFSVLLLIFIERKRFTLYPRLTLLFACALLGGIILLQAKIIEPKIFKEAVLERSTSILRAHKNFRNDTLYMRFLESKYAWEKIKDYPLLGIGLGTPYRQNIFGNTSYERNVGGTMVHSGYLAGQLKMGILGTVTIFSMAIVFLVRAFKRWWRIETPLYRAVVLGITVYILGLMFLNIGPSPFLTVTWVAVVATSMGITERIYQLEGIA
jgi:O-antigen ligase